MQRMMLFIGVLDPIRSVLKHWSKFEKNITTGKPMLNAVFIDTTQLNAIRIVQAIQQFGFGSLDLTEQDFLEPDTIIQLGYPPRRIDLLTSLPGVSFHDSFPTRIFPLQLE
jgi:hypothetical protein